MQRVGSAAWSGRCRWTGRHVARSCRAQPQGHARPSRDAPGSELSVNNILECVVHQRQVGVHALELGVLVLQLPQLRQVRDRHTRELALPLVVRRLADAVLPARLGYLRAKLDFLEDADHLRFTESGLLHVETPAGGILYFQLVQVFEGTSEGHRRSCDRARTCRRGSHKLAARGTKRCWPASGRAEHL